MKDKRVAANHIPSAVAAAPAAAADSVDAQHPQGRDAVISALIDATVDLIVEEGLAISVRQIASRAGVNHGLVHAYFGSKEALLTAAFDHINSLAAAEVLPSGFPPVDIAERNDGRLAKAIARVMLDGDGDAFSSHPIMVGWREALGRRFPDEAPDLHVERVVIASTLAVGWALFSDYFSSLSDADDTTRLRLNARVRSLIAELGGIPAEDSLVERPLV